MSNRNTSKIESRIRIFIYFACLIIFAGIALRAAWFLRDFVSEAACGSDDIAFRALLVRGLSLMANVGTLLFLFRIIRCLFTSKQLFCVAQTGRVFGIGLLFLVDSLLGLLLPFAPTRDLAPMLDLRLLSFAFIFFALAGVFEYGRILQEDSDSIV